jgi:hypothetical protein
VRARVEGDPVGRAAARIRAVHHEAPAALGAQQFQDLHARVLQGRRDRPRGRRHRSRGAVADHDGGRDRLAGQHLAGVRRDVGPSLFVGRVGQVVAEGQAHPVARAADAEDDQALARVEAQQAGHDGQHRGGRG